MTAKRKSFGLGGKSKKEDQLGQMRGIEQAANVLDAPISPGSGDMRLVPIDEVRVDPNNPRRLNIDWDTVQQDPATIDDSDKRKEIEAIQGLAQTIRTVGQRSPVEVVRDGGIKRVVVGERRYWAVRLAELPSIKAIVLHSVPDNVPLIQLIENIQRKEMPLWETILNIRLVMEREEELGVPVKDATDLMERAGLTRATAYRYWRYVKLPSDVEAVLEARTIRTHDELSSLLKIETAAKRKQAIANYLAGGSLAPKSEQSSVKSSTSSTPRSRGRPKTTISFGSTKNLTVAQHLFEKLDPKGDYAQTDWQDVAAVSKAWKRLLSKLEKQLETNG
jgi:ParB/RepB/Spo0J family partition protein